MIRGSLLRRLLTVVVIAAIPAFAAHISFQIWSDMRAARVHTATDTQDVAAVMMPLLKSALIVGDLATVQEALDAIAEHGHFRTLKAVGEDASHVLAEGRRSASGESAGLPEYLALWFDLRFPEQNFPIQVGGVRYGALVAEPSTVFLAADIWQRFWTSAAIWLVTLAIFLVLVRIALRQGLRPLSDLADTAHRLGAGDLSCRAPISDVRELAETAVAFNRMAEGLGAAQREAEAFQALLERRVQERTSDLERANAELEQFAYVASHDLRQPLRMVSSYLGLIERKLGQNLDPDIRDFMDFAIGGAKKMDALIRDLLEYSRTGRSATDREAVDLGDAVAEALADLKPAIENRQAEIRVQPGLPVVVACRSDIVRLFQNLLGNALKYQDGARKAVIIVACRPVGDDWELSVQDNGIGIPPDQIDRVFRIFQRLHSDKDYEGTGIGLAICQKIVACHGGRIWAESEPGQGSTFRFTLPKRRDGAA